MSARAWDAGLGVTFAAFGAGLAWAGHRRPEGLAGVPGPGFFPMLIGVGLMVLGLSLAVSAGPGRPAYWDRGWRDPALARVAALLALLAAHVALWDAVPFVLRTPVVLAGIYLVVGEPWLRSVALAIGTTAVLAGVFEILLRVRL